MTYEYDGYLKPHLSKILAMLRDGKSPDDVVAQLPPHQYYYTTPKPMVVYIARRYGIPLKPQVPDTAGRNEAMMARRQEGATFDTLAKEFGISRSRAQNIVNRTEYRRRLMEERMAASADVTDVASMPVDLLDVPFRVLNVLKNLECVTVGDILKLSDYDLLSTPNFGRSRWRT